MPSSWAEVRARLAWVLGGPGVADEWLHQAIVATYGVDNEFELPQQQRALALQKAIGTLYGLEDLGSDGLLPLQDDPRSRVAAVFARYWGGVVLDGPPWRLSPHEARPAEGELSSDFDFMEDL